MDGEDIEWFKGYARETTQFFSTRFNTRQKQFPNWKALIRGFNNAIDNVLAGGLALSRAVDEAHNELCIADAILYNPAPQFLRLDCEPRLRGCKKSIDFRARSQDGFTLYADVKTIRPVLTDRRDQYQRALKQGWLPDNVRLVLSDERLGGEIWHSMFAARSRMLEYTLELEQKIHAGELEAEKALFVLAFCGEGFYWHEHHLEDFVHFYYRRSYRSDDPFSKAEANHLAEQKIDLARTVSQFACMCRPHGNARPWRLNWDVRPPRQPWLRSLPE